jgi:hypothetical protein
MRLLAGLVGLSIVGLEMSCQRNDLERFFQLDKEEQLKRFKTLVPEEQFQIFQASMQKQHLLTFAFVDVITHQAEKALPFLSSKLENPSDDRQLRNTIILFLRLASYGELERRHDILELLARRVSSMNDPDARRQSRKMLAQIWDHVAYKSFFFGSSFSSSEERHRAFLSYPLERQLGLYFYAMTIEPPQTGYADDLVRQGSKVIPVLATALEMDYDESKTQNIIYAFAALAESGQLCGREDIVGLIKRHVELAKDSELVTRFYSRISKATVECSRTK